MKTFRAESLDALRGFAIFMMVLSGSICAEILPAWMSHAQVPPGGSFDPTIPGITWVDLVFPFFLFAMGAAFPFSVGSRIERGESRGQLCMQALWRGIKLAFFAIFIAHVNPWVQSYFAGTEEIPLMWLISLLAFGLLFPMFLRLPGNPKRSVRVAVQWGGIVAGIVLMLLIECRNGRSFDINRSNIILLVLANMAFFGTVIYILTYRNIGARLAVLPPLMAILLSQDADGSWQQAVFNWTPLPWLYRFMFLKYLFIIIPGTIAGEYLREWVKRRDEKQAVKKSDSTFIAFILVLSIALLIINVVCLFGRFLVINFVLSVVLSLAVYLCARRLSCRNSMIFKIVQAGAYLLFTGLCFEAFQGAIRKDPSTFSYYLVTSGLACFCLISFMIICDIYECRKSTALLTMSGKNPMIAYVATVMFTMPLLDLLHLGDHFTYGLFASNPLLGFIHGLVLTIIACLIAMFFTRIKWFWRT